MNTNVPHRYFLYNLNNIIIFLLWLIHEKLFLLHDNNGISLVVMKQIPQYKINEVKYDIIGISWDS